MKKILLILIITFSISAFAQDKERHERIKALKIAFITERLNLTTSEAQNFWPIYNTFEAENQKLRKESIGKFKKVDFETLSEKDAKDQLEDWMAAEEKKHELRQQFTNDLLKVLPAKKIIKLKATEDAFNRRMMQEMKRRREGLRKNHP